MNLSLPRGAVFPFTLLAFNAVGVQYLWEVFTPTTRWLWLAFLIFALVRRGAYFFAFATRFGFILGLYLAWMAATVLWSQVPILTFSKSIAYFLTVLAFVAAGTVWSEDSEKERRLSYLLPVVALALFAGLLGRGNTVLIGGNLVYRGLAYNSNVLGMFAAVGIGYALYRSYWAHESGASFFVRAFAYGLLACLLTIVWLSGSRASALCALSTLVAFGIAVLSRKTILTLSLVSVLGIGGALAIPSVGGQVFQNLLTFAVKSNIPDRDVFASRQETWQDSYDAARQSGMLGVGLGVSAGATDFAGGLTSAAYGREKSNSQLAVWEECGLIGLGLYVILLVQITRCVASKLKAISDKNTKIQGVLLSGILIGLVAQSIFEAWWTAPGSQESTCFWATLGVLIGLPSSQLAHDNDQELVAEPDLPT